MTTKQRRQFENEARALGADHYGRGFAPVNQGDWPKWKAEAYMEGYAAAAKKPRANPWARTKALRKALRGRLR